MTLGRPGPDCEEAGVLTNMDAYWDSANELLNRIHRLERSQQGWAASATDTTPRRGVGEMSEVSLGEEEIRAESTPPARAEQNAPRGGAWPGRDPPYRWRGSSTRRPLPQRNHEEEEQRACVRDGHAATYPVQAVRTVFEH